LHIISRKKLLEAAREHGEIDGPLDSWYRTAKSAKWKNLEEVRRTYSHADGVPVGERVLRIPMMSISHSNLMPIRSERSDAGLSQFETVIDISQEFCLFSLS